MSLRWIECVEDTARGVLTYELSDGRRIKFDRRAVQDYGVSELLRHAGLGAFVPEGRMDVVQDGRVVGTLPAAFDPHSVRSRSPFYDPRPGDFWQEGNTWVAERRLGPGDLEAVVGFQHKTDGGT